MTPTPKLRFVERQVYVEKPIQDLYIGQKTITEQVKKTILQQWWQVASIGQITTNGEWRDVPTEKEQS